MLRRVSVVCLVLVCLVGDVRAQTARGQGLYEVRIEGTVQTSDGAVLPGATASLGQR